MGILGFLVRLRNKVGLPQIGQPARHLRSNIDRDPDVPSRGWNADRDGPRHGRKDFSGDNPAINGKTSNPIPMLHAPRANLNALWGHQIDSIVPSYACPKADSVRDAFQAVPAWTDHLQENAALKARLDSTLGTAGLADWASWCKGIHLSCHLPLHE